MDNASAVNSLREALKFSPDNLPLREHLAGTLMSFGMYAEAAVEYQTALAQAPTNRGYKLGLAEAFYYSGKFMESLVVVEDLLKHPKQQDAKLEAKVYLLHARLLLNDGKPNIAAEQYEKARETCEEIRDEALEEQLNYQPVKSKSPSDANRHLEPNDAGDFDDIGNDDFDVQRSSVTFEHVGGMDQVKEQIRMKIIYPITNASMFAAYGKKIGGGILLFGPPGCGKTHLARATAGEIKASFICVEIADVLDMWIGASERNLHELFEQARRNKPCVMFFDEVDALAASRADMRGAGGRQVINQFLQELDGIDSKNEGILVLAATNAPWHLDSAFRRPGRFDRIIFVPPPDAPARAAILRILLEGKPQDKIDLNVVAKKTDKFSGADLKAVIDIAVEKKLEKAMKTGELTPLTTKDLEESASKMKPSTMEWLAQAKNYALYSNQGGTYDDIMAYLKSN